MKKTIKHGLQLPVLVVIMLLFSMQNAYADGAVLAKVDIISSISQLGLPIHAHLQGTTGQDYALVIATESQLNSAGFSYKTLETIPSDFEGTAYIIALERINGARTNATGQFNVLFDDGRNIVARVSESGAEQLVQMGFEIEWLSKNPIVISQTPGMSLMAEATLAVDYNAIVQEMIDAVTQTKIYDYTANISGETPVIIGGSNYTITSRHTGSGTSIQKATQYMYEFMQGLGLGVSYQDWTYGSYSNRNVVGELTGTVSPGEIVLVTAHLDSMPSGGTSPGADDNGSGSVGVMVAAEMFASKSFERTVRFVFFTGEEQGLYGSRRYADKVVSDGDNIVAVYNLDMIAWDNVGGPTLRIHTRTSSSSGYSGDMALANTFVDVVNTYGMGSVLTPIIDSDGVTASDHSSFWNKGFSAILAIEDDVDDFCDNYHTVNDTLSTLNMTYYTNYVKASVGTAAHLATVVGGSVLNANFTQTSSLLETTFSDISTAPTGETITGWSWDFGDGETSTIQNPVHTYAVAGTYNVSLTVTDSASGTDSVTKAVTVTNTLDYCTAGSTNQNDEWIAQVNVGSFTNSSGKSSYTDYTSMVIDVQKGAANSLSLVPGFTSTAYSEFWRIWIDYNKDGDFDDAGETVFSGDSKSTVTGSFTAPVTAVTGHTTMRISMQYNAYAGPCGSFTYGEVEDYTVNLTEPQTGPVASYTSSTEGLTATFTDTSATTGGSIVSWNWTFGDDATSTTQNPSHTYSTAGTYTVTLTVTDSNSATDSVSQEVTVSDVVLKYCTSQGDNANYEWVDQVDIGTFTNSSGAAGYSDFTSMVVDMTPGQSYNTTLSPGFASNIYTEYWKVWIDFNRDGDFIDSGEEVFSNSGTSDVSGSIVIPAAASPGNTRMRISMGYDGAPSSCGSFTYGEVEDYTVNIGN